MTRGNVGLETINWLYSDHLKVDQEWSVRTPSGFTWWAHRHAQSIEVVGEETGPGGDKGYLIRVSTDFLHDLELSPKSLEVINGLLMPFASMSGPVYDPGSRTLKLSSLVRVHGGIAHWMRLLIGMASVLQIAEAGVLASQLAEELEAQDAESGHPANGLRPAPDEMARIVQVLIAPMGKGPSRWQDDEFEEAVERYMQQPPSIGANSGGSGLTVEFPFGKGESSLLQIQAREAHPAYGNGLLLIQSFPTRKYTGAAGIRYALELNASDLARVPAGYGFGSYTFQDGMVQFCGFLPNAAYQHGLLPNLYFACAERARQMSVRLTGKDWSEASFSPKNSALGRMTRGLPRR